MRNLGIGILIGLAVAAVIYALVVGNRPAPQGPSAAPPMAAAPAIEVKPSGDYAGDWQTRCGPMTGPAQADCTAKLDAAYGRKAEVAVPDQK